MLLWNPCFSDFKAKCRSKWHPKMVEKWSKKQDQKLKISRVTPESWDQGQVVVTVPPLRGLQATKPDGCRTPNINVTVYPACKLQYTCRQISQMVILRDLKDFRISNVHVAKDMPLSLVALKGPADPFVGSAYWGFGDKELIVCENYIVCFVFWSSLSRNLAELLWYHPKFNV